MDLSMTLCVFSLLLLGYSYAQEIRIKDFTDGQILERQTASSGIAFTCLADGIGDTEKPGLKWIGPDDKVIETGGNRRLLSSRAEVMLIFDTLRKIDAGNYRCEGNINGNLMSYSISLELFDGISVESDPKQTPVIHTNAVIRCKVNNGNANVRWVFPNNSAITGSRYRQMTDGLEIRNITEEDNGLYLCLVIASGGTAETFTIDVKVTVPPSMKGSPTVTSTVVGNLFEMTCEADGKPAPTFVFKKGDQEIVNEPGRFQTSQEPLDPKIPNVVRGKLVIESLLNTDEGWYTCKASNQGGEIEEKLFIDTKVAPTIQPIVNASEKDSSPVELICRAEGDPAPQLTWEVMNSDITILKDPAKGIDIQEDTESSGQSDLIKKVTSRLKFANVKPEDANSYTCTAQNEAGQAKQTGKITVQFKPNFADTPYSSTYGWVNHDTKIRCITNAVPVAGISWKHGDQAITEGGSYKFSVTGGNPQTVGVLTVSINVENEQTIFGPYTCVAHNLHGEAEHNIDLMKAVVPGAPTISIRETSPTTIDLLITPPKDDGGQPIIDYKIEYYAENDEQGKVTRRAFVNTDPNESRTSFLVDGLKAKTRYLINVQARNEVDYGAAADISDTTLEVRVPSVPEITSGMTGVEANKYTLVWKKPLSGGRPLTGYNIKYFQVEAEMVDGSLKTVKVIGEAVSKAVKKGQTTFTLSGLQPDSHYELSISAINSIGKSKPDTIILKTAPGSDSGPGTGVIIGILVAVIIILFIVIDVTFYFTKQCGLLWTIQGKVSGGDGAGERTDAEAADHEKEAFIKKGKQDSEEPSAKVNVEAVNETDMAEEEVKMKEFEPEDKEEKPDTESADEVTEKEAPPASSPQSESAVDPPAPTSDPTPDVTITEPDAEDKDPKV